MDATIREVLDFWFAEDNQAHWFKPDAAFDRAVADRLGPLYERAAAGAFDSWRSSAQGCLALCILLDQVPRQMYRGQARAFATDADALALTFHALDAGHDRELPLDQRLFLYLPLMHSERMADQDRCVAIFQEPEWRDKLSHAVEHAELIRRFGRFPHRNAALGRASTADEEAHLAQTDRHFGQGPPGKP